MSLLRTKIFLLICSLFFIISSADARSRDSGVRKFGDYAQIINPVLVAGLASQDKGFGHFAAIYAQDFITMHGVKYISNKAKWSASKRPFIEDKNDRYDGMPSGHTNSAWIAAAYMRTFSQDHKYLSIPLYISAAVTGYSRVHAKEHTVAQVVVGALMAEAFVFVNNKMDWSNEYRSTNFYFGKQESSLSFEFKF